MTTGRSAGCARAGPTARLKQHPGLVPYSELSEGEKAYDRVTAMETLKAIYALGYRIVPK